MGSSASKAPPDKQEEVKEALVTACNAVQAVVMKVLMLEKVETEEDLIAATGEIVELITEMARKTAAKAIERSRAEHLNRALDVRRRSNAGDATRAMLERRGPNVLVIELMLIGRADVSDTGDGSGSSRERDNPRIASPTITHPWTPIDQLGRGTFGSVYSAVDMNGFKFAVKEVLKDGIREESSRNEIKFLGRFCHKNIVQFYGCAENETIFYIYMELMQGSLLDWMNKSGKPITETNARRHTQDLLQGLIYLHGQNVIHRDIKCANVLLNASGTAKLADMGIAKMHDQSTLGRPAGDIVGSIPWMSPEVLSGQEGGKRSDVWSVGCTVFEMVRGQPPFVDGLPPILCSMILPRMIIGLGHSKLVSDDEDFGPAIKHFLMRIFVKMDERESAEKVAEYPWVRQ